jgi:DNA polymerase I-like protein with 3'-5' exonuclease and polymerase domains
MTSIAIDTETTGVYFHHGCRAFMVTACDEDGLLYCWQWKVNPATREVIYDKKQVDNLYKTLTSYDTWIFHNAAFDLTALEYIPFSDTIHPAELGIDVHDTMVMAHCHNSLDRLGLKGLALQYLQYSERDEKELHKAVAKARRLAKKYDWAIADSDHPHLRPQRNEFVACDYWLPKSLLDEGVSLSPGDRDEFAAACKRYAIGDVERTMGLYIFFKEVITKRGDYDHYERNRECIIPLWEMQKHGLYLDRKKIPALISDLDQIRQSLIMNMQRLCGIKRFNPRSPNHLKEALYERLALDPISFTKTGQASTDKDALNDLLRHADLSKKQDLFIRRLLTYRKLNTAASYLESYGRFEVDSKLFTNINPVGTITTRCASRNPNTQNISKQESDEENLDLTVSVNLREVFGPPPGKLWLCIDYAQLQLRIFAYACKDEFLINAFKQGLDIHDTVAKKVFNTDVPSSLQRRAAKAINFGIIFGAGQRKIDRMSGIPGSYFAFKNQFPLVDRYLDLCERQAKRTGFVRTMGGYPLRVQRATAYKACNLIVQGTEGEMVKKAINDVTIYCSDLAVPIRPIMTIHDEIIFESKTWMTKEILETKCKKHILKIKHFMNAAGRHFGVETEVDAKVAVSNWKSTTKLSLV